MNKYMNYLLLVCIPVAFFSCKEAGTTKPDSTITLNWEDEKQTIDGFGVAQAGWSDRLYAHHKRNEVMNLMFGKDGLQLSILRGEIFPHYWENTQDTDFNLNDDINIPFTDSVMKAQTDDCKRRGQLWISKEAKEKYHVDKLFYSAWTAPAYMKSNGKVSDGELKPEYYQAYADYLVAFYKAYTSIGLEPYALSPSNEPGYAAPWNSSIWSAEKMGTFLAEYLCPTFKKEGIPAHIIFGENPLWSVVSPRATFASSYDFVTTILQQHPDLASYNMIASGHGYTLPDSYPAPLDSLRTPIIPFEAAEKAGIHVWLTEISDVAPLDTTIEDGIRWAKTWYDYLVEANTNACVWWAGALPAGNNEGLIVLKEDRENYFTTKRFYTFGNYTRYIPVGSTRIGTEGLNTPDSLYVSAFKNGKDFTVVAINPTDSLIRTNLQPAGKEIDGTVTRILTDKENNWQTYTTDANILEIPGKSVATFTGKIK